MSSFIFLFVCLDNFWYHFGVFNSWIMLWFHSLWCWFFELHNVSSDLYSLLLFCTAVTEIRLWSLYHCSDTLTPCVSPSLFNTSRWNFVHAEHFFHYVSILYHRRWSEQVEEACCGVGVTTFYLLEKCIKPKSNCKMLAPLRTGSGPFEHHCELDWSWPGITEFAVRSKIT